MLAHKYSTVVGRFTSVVAVGFLLWTLGSPTFSNASVKLVQRKLQTVQKLGDRTAQQLDMLFHFCLR